MKHALVFMPDRMTSPTLTDMSHLPSPLTRQM